MQLKRELVRSAPMLTFLGVFLAEYVLVLAVRPAPGTWVIFALALPIAAAYAVERVLRRFEWYRPS